MNKLDHHLAQSDSSHIGAPHRRLNAKRHVSGRGKFVSDIELPGMVHCAFVRSPMASGEIKQIDFEAVENHEGLLALYTSKELNTTCQPWTGKLDHFAGMESPSHNILADKFIHWTGQPVVLVVAKTRAIAEDICDLIYVDIDEGNPVVSIEAALDKNNAAINKELSNNICYETVLETPDVDDCFKNAALTIEQDFAFGRQTGVTLEPRSILADFDPSSEQLTVYHATQTPYQFQDIYARHFDLKESRVRVIAPDVGGSFGMKLHVYNEEMAVVAASILLQRPIRFIADRLESFVSDIHVREHQVHAKMALDKQGKILAMAVDDMAPIGAVSAYPRTSVVEGNQVIRLMGAPYQMKNYRGRLSVLFQNKVQTSQYRAVGHPIACAVTERMCDIAAQKLGIDVFEMRARNLIQDDAYPCSSATGYQFEKLSHEQCLKKLHEMMDYDGLRKEQIALREKNIYRGIGIAPFVEITNPGAAFYGVGGARISAQDGATIKLTPSGEIQCAISITEQGQGTETIVAQIVAEKLGVSPHDVKVMTGDTDTTPSGGATWACRGAGIGGETAFQASEKLKRQILKIAGTILQVEPLKLDLAKNAIVQKADKKHLLDLSELARIVYYRSDTLPNDSDISLTVSHHFAPKGYPFDFTNGIQASYVEVDIETGFVKLLNHWVVEDCGRIINPLLVDEQIRGGVVQGLGAAFFEECLYDDNGQLTNATLAEYLVPMACEMPDVKIAHIETPTQDTELGAKGVGEAGTAAAGAAAMNAVNDALIPMETSIHQTPMTPMRILNALGIN